MLVCRSHAVATYMRMKLVLWKWTLLEFSPQDYLHPSSQHDEIRISSKSHYDILHTLSRQEFILLPQRPLQFIDCFFFSCNIIKISLHSPTLLSHHKGGYVEVGLEFLYAGKRNCIQFKKFKEEEISVELQLKNKSILVMMRKIIAKWLKQPKLSFICWKEPENEECWKCS